jgi:hypothetical protein
LFALVPVIHFHPYKITSATTETHYEIPIYKTIVRAGAMNTNGQSTNFITAVQLPYTRTPDFWIMQGAAIFCSLPYWLVFIIINLSLSVLVVANSSSFWTPCSLTQIEAYSKNSMVKLIRFFHLGLCGCLINNYHKCVVFVDLVLAMQGW